MTELASPPASGEPHETPTECTEKTPRWIFPVIAALVILASIPLGVVLLGNTGKDDLAVQQVADGSREHPFVLSNTGELVVTLNDPSKGKVVKLKAGVAPEWRVIDSGHVVLVRVFDLKARGWSEWSEFTSTTIARYIPKIYDRIEFKAPALGSNNTVRIKVKGAPYEAVHS